MGELTEKLQKNSQSDMYPFHMPGHKRNLQWNINPYSYDVTEIEGFDDMHNPKDILLNLTNRVNVLYGAKDSFVLVNGSTSGILSAISAAVDYDEKLLLARNSHKSAYNGAYLRRVKAEYIYPEIDKGTGIALQVTPEDIEKAYAINTDIRAVLVVSPTYEGVVSDIKAIAKTVHDHGGILIVDCAHGAHFGIGGGFPPNPLQLGADVVIMSVHKTLPALTQTAVMCVGTDRVDVDGLKRFTDIYVSSSPSYVLMASVEKCLDIMEKDGEKLQKEHFVRMTDFRNKCSGFKRLYLFDSDNYDVSKVVICTDRCEWNGARLMKELREKYHLELEMASKEYVVAMTSCADTDEGLERLYRALREIDGKLTENAGNGFAAAPVLDKIYEPWQIYNKAAIEIPFSNAEGRIAMDYIYIYPPGIPWVVPGEKISKELMDTIMSYGQSGLEVHGLKEENIIRVLDLEKYNG